MDTLSSNIWFVWQEKKLYKEGRERREPYALQLQIDLARAISANQGLIILTQKENAGYSELFRVSIRSRFN